MARILYAASGDGYGHATRAHSVGAALLARGHDVRFLTSHKTRGYLRRHFPERVWDVFGLRTVYNQGRAEAVRTLVYNVGQAWDSLRPSNLAVRRLIRELRPELVITDFEPFAAFWARWLCIPFISLDNQHLLTHCEVDRPQGVTRDLINAYLTIRLYYGGAKRYLITTFIDAPIRHHPTTLVAPILRQEVYGRRPKEGGFLLAYKGAGGRNDALKEALESFDRRTIRAYGFGKEGARGHVIYRATDPDAFLDDLAACDGVIATAGHSLVSECLFFEKPMLLLPLRGQYEQIINAHYVQKFGFGRSVDRVDRSTLDTFTDRLDHYRTAMAGIPKPRLDSVIDAIERELV